MHLPTASIMVIDSAAILNLQILHIEFGISAEKCSRKLV